MHLLRNCNKEYRRIYTSSSTDYYINVIRTSERQPHQTQLKFMNVYFKTLF